MPSPIHETFAETIAARIHAERYVLATRWLDRLIALIPVGPNEVFATEALLDHIPKLIEQIAKFLAAPENEIASDTFVIGEARELGELRHEQRASVHQLLREYELLRNILGAFVGEDVGRLELILTNLLSNAIKYSDPAKPDRFVEVLPVRSEESGSGFQVRDNGLGMTAEQLKRVFTPFFRARANLEQTHHIEGLGLGLCIVRDCVDAIGASIDVVAAPNEGTTFTVTLPVKTAS
jgi:signal transduction histidine kinase